MLMKPSNEENVLVWPDNVLDTEAEVSESYAFGRIFLASVNDPLDPMSHCVFKGFLLLSRGTEETEPKTVGRRDS